MLLGKGACATVRMCIVLVWYKCKQIINIDIYIIVKCHVIID